MAKGDYIVAKVTPKANEVNLESFTNSENMPAIKYFAAAYDPDLILRDGEGANLGVKTPWFDDAYPDGADPGEYKKYDSSKMSNMALKNEDGSDMEFDNAREAEDYANEREISGVLKYEENGKFKILCCDIKSGQVVGVPKSDDGPAEIRATLEKLVNKYDNDYTDSDGNLLDAPNANVFYILDEDWNIIVVLHAYGFTFKGRDKWEIVQHLIYQHDVPVTGIVEDPDPFYFKTASEILLPDEIIGDDTDREAGKASRVIENFDPASSSGSALGDGDLNDKRTLFLETAGPLTNDIERTDDNARFDMENPGAILDLNGNSLTLSGKDLRGYLSVADNAEGEGSLTISGERAGLRLNLTGLSDSALNVSGADANLEITSDNEKALNFTGTGRCVINGRVHLRKDADIGGNLTVSGDIGARHITAAGDAEIGGGLKLSGSQNLDMGGASLVNCRTISELFKDGLVWFDGENHYAEAPDDDYLNFGEYQGFSFLLAFRTDTYKGPIAFLLNKGRDSDDSYYRIYLDADNYPTAEIKIGGTTATARSERAVNEGRIHAALVRCDRAGNLELYLDGIRTGAADISSLNGDIGNAQPLFLARDGEDTPGGYFKGEMFLVRVWDDLLSEEEAVEFSANPCSPMEIGANKNDIFLNDLTNWDHSSLSVFQTQNDHVNNSAEAFEFTSDGGSHRLAYIDIEPLGLRLGQKYRLQFDVKHLGTGDPCYASLNSTGQSLFQHTMLFHINKDNVITINAEDGAIVREYTNGFRRLAFEFTYSENTRYLSFDGTVNKRGMYLDNVFLYTYSQPYSRYLALSAEGLGEPDRWLDSGSNQLHATLNAEVLKSARHAGDLEVTGELKLSGSKNLDMGGAALVNCRTISELFRDGLVWFDGESHYVEAPNDNYLNFAADQGFSFLLAFRTDRDNGSPTFLLNKGRDSDDSYYRIYLDADNYPTAEIKIGGTTATARSERGVNEGRIHAVLVRCDRAGNLELWLDGIRTGAADISALSGDIGNTQPLFLAKDGEETPGGHFKGEMFLIRVWDCPLSREDAAEFSTSPHSQSFLYPCASVRYLNNISNWNNIALPTFRTQSSDVNNSPNAFHFEAGNWAHRASVGLNLKSDGKYRLEFDVKHIGNGEEWYGGLAIEYNSDVFDNDDANELFYINNSQYVQTYTRGSATYGAVINEYDTGFKRLAFEFTRTANTAYLVFEARDVDGGIYLDNLFCEKVGDNNKYCMELSSDGLGEPDRWLDSGPYQLDATLNAEVLKNTRHAGDLEVTGSIKPQNIELIKGDGSVVSVDGDKMSQILTALNL